MKKTHFARLCAFFTFIFLFLPFITQAAVMLPKEVTIGDASRYDAGTTVQMNFVDGSKGIEKKNNIEYGIARTIKTGEYTSFEILSTETKSLTGMQSVGPLGIVIPNLAESSAKDSYIAYVKFFEKDNPDNESFYFTKEFGITANNTPFIQVKNINLLQSNGRRFGTQEGPSIYSPQDASQYPSEKLATSTSVEVTFVSNQDTTITPTILFSKIRSDSFTEQYTAPSISIKKGTTYAVIPLPVFDYAPGVYMGKLSFGNPLLKNTVDVQFIVSGDSVSVGGVIFGSKDKNTVFTFDVFGTPLDLERYDASSTTPRQNVYSVTTEFIQDGRTVYTATQDVDFNGQTYSVEVPKKIKAIENVRITVVSPKTNAVVYEATKDIDFSNNSGMSMSLVLYVLLYIVLTVCTVLAVFKGKAKTAIVLAVLLIGLFFSRQAFSDYSIEQYSTLSQETYFNNEKTGAVPKLYLQDDVPNTTYACGEDIRFTFKVNYLRCSNTAALIDVGFSRTNYEDAYAKRTRISNSLASETILGTIKGHNFYSAVSPFVSRTIANVPEANSKIYITLEHGVNNEVRTGFNRYTIPLKNTCDMVEPTCTCTGRTQTCSKSGTVVSTTPNSPSCSFRASCGVTTSGNTATFNTITTNALGAVTYKDADTGAMITNPFTRSITPGQQIVQRIIATDTDGSSATVSCTALTNSTGGGNCPDGSTNCFGTENPGTTTKVRVPTITKFTPKDKVVPKNKSCSYSWSVKDVDVCTLTVNNNSVLLSGNGLNGGPIDVAAADGNNQRAQLTCVARDEKSGDETISTTTLCQVIPEVIER